MLRPGVISDPSCCLVFLMDLEAVTALLYLGYTKPVVCCKMRDQPTFAGKPPALFQSPENLLPYL